MRVQVAYVACLAVCAALGEAPVHAGADATSTAAPATLRATTAREGYVGADCDPRSHGAVGDNATDDTAALQAAIHECGSAGGGRVVLRAPYAFRSKPLRLLSGVELHVEASAALVAWPDLKAWPNSTAATCDAAPYEQKPNIVPVLEALIYADGATDISVTGNGVIDGQGWRWWPLWVNKVPPAEYWHNCRPKMLRLNNVVGLTLQGVTLLDSPMYNVACTNCSDVLITQVNISAGCGYNVAPNTDGFNLNGQNMVLTDNVVKNGDDCVPLGVPGKNGVTRNVTVDGLRCECGNGVVPVIWSVPGTIEDVVFRNVELVNTGAGITVKSLPSFSGMVRRVVWDKISMTNVQQGIYINAFGQGDDVSTSLTSPNVMTVQDVNITNVVGTGISAAGKFMCSPSQPCSGLHMENITLSGAAGLHYTCQAASGTYSNCTPAPCF